MTTNQYNDDYPTCAETHATLCVYMTQPDFDDPDEVSRELGIEATDTNTRRFNKQKRRSGWFLETRGILQSKDIRRHVDWLLTQVSDKTMPIKNLRDKGCEIVISCYWLSAHGHGGPMLSAETMQILGELGIEIWFDIYFSDSAYEEFFSPLGT